MPKDSISIRTGEERKSRFEAHAEVSGKSVTEALNELIDKALDGDNFLKSPSEANQLAPEASCPFLRFLPDGYHCYQDYPKKLKPLKIGDGSKEYQLRFCEACQKVINIKNELSQEAKLHDEKLQKAMTLVEDEEKQKIQRMILWRSAHSGTISIPKDQNKRYPPKWDTNNP